MRKLFPLAATVALTAALMLAPCAVFAQTKYGFRLPVYTRDSLTAGGRVWTIGAPEMIAASNVVDVLPSRDFKHLLIVRQTRALTSATTPHKVDDNAPGELSVTWWNVKMRRSRELWRCDLKPGETGNLWCGRWFANSNTVAMSFTKGKDRRILMLKPAFGEAKEIVLPPTAYDLPQPSPTQNYVALSGFDGACEGQIHFLDASGKVGDAIALPGTVWFDGWSDDGTERLGFVIMKIEGEADETKAYRKQWYAVNPAKRTVTPIATPPLLDASGYRVQPAETTPADALPLRLVPDEAGNVRIEAFPPAKGTAAKKSVLLSRDAQPGFILPDGSAVFFWRDGALYAAPIVSAVTKPVSTNPAQ